MNRHIPYPLNFLVTCSSSPCSPANWTVPGPNGSSTTFIITNELYFDSNPSSIQNIQLPDGRSWHFDYDPVSGYDPVDLRTITLPTGDQISYTWQWANLPITCAYSLGDVSSVVGSRHARVIATRKIGASSNPWQYNYVSINAPGGIPVSGIGATNETDVGAPYGVLVTDPEGNQTIHVMQGIGGTCTYREIKTLIYQGAIGTGILINTKTTTYAYDPVQQQIYVGQEPAPGNNLLNVWVTDESDDCWDTGPVFAPSFHVRHAKARTGI